LIVKKSLNDKVLVSHQLMEQAKINQLQIEVNTWKRFLNFFRDENVCLKNRLSDILKNGFDRNLLEELENFQTKFIKHDEVISLLRNEIAELDRLLSIERSGDGLPDEKIDKEFDHLRNIIVTSEREFCKLQLNFNIYLSKNI
jgi:predicted RNase H-like nuclease (RuvC/YqgF family)